MKNLEIENILPVLYRFYNNDLWEFDDNGKRTKEQEEFINYTEIFYHENYSKWLNYMEKLARKINFRFWDTTYYNRQSFSGYFLLNNNEENRILIMISTIYNIYYIDDETNSNDLLILYLIEEIEELFPSYSKVNKRDLNGNLKPYFKCFSKMEDIFIFNIHDAFFGKKPPI